MKNRRFLFFAIFLLTLFLHRGLAQNQHKIDSLKLISNKADTDTLKIKAYKNICWEYAITRLKLDSARFYADSINIISHKINYEEGIALSHFYYGLIDRFGGNYYEGLSHLDKYLEFYQKKGDSLKMEAGLFQKGAIHMQLGNYVETLDIYHRILYIYKNNDMLNSAANTLHVIGHIQRKINKHTEAIENYKQAITIKRQLNDVTGLSMSVESLGNTYGELEKYGEAEHYLLKALDIVRSEERLYGIASVTENLGNLYSSMGNYQKALNFHLESLSIRKGLPSKKNLATGFNKVGLAYMKLGNINLAKKNLFEGLNIAKRIKVIPLIIDGYKALTELNELDNNISEAFKYQKLYMDVKDSMFTVEKNKQLIELETKYETVQKDKEIALLNKENELKEKEAQRQDDIKKAILIGLFLTLLFAGLLFYTLRQKLKNQKLLAVKNEEIKVSNLKKELGTLEMKALRAQMNPHFLFNCMNSINTMIIRDDNANASKYLTKFSKLVRLMLENSENPKVTLKDELEMLKAYIQLESIRFKNKMDYKINVAESIDKESTFLPSMVLQPFVENAIWHGLLHKESKGLLTIDITEEDDYLHCSITDNGVGREKSLKLQKQSGFKKKSMGIKITADRLKLLTKQKINEVIKIIDLKDNENNAMGTQVDILIPIS